MGPSDPHEILDAWRESAFYWEKHRTTIRSLFDPVTRALAREARIAVSHSVLDLAGGVGEPSLSLAEVVGNEGRIVCTDAVFQMVAAARAEAARLQLRSILFCECKADAIPFESGLFDAVVSRFGTMFFPDPGAAVAEMLRVLKPGGRVALAVWGPSQANPFFSIVTDVLARYIEPEPEDPEAPGAFRFASPGKLARIVCDAGAAAVTERVFDFELSAEITASEFWDVRAQLSDTLRQKVKRLSAEQLALTRAEIEARVSPFFDGKVMRVPGQAIVVVGVATQ